MLNLPRLVLLLLCGIATGCAGLFPNSRSEISSPFMSFDEARNAIEQVIPYQTKVADLAALGFDPRSNYNVTLIPYPEIVGRLAPHPGVPLSAMDPGVQDCIVAQNACRAYVFRLGSEQRQREGNFLLDFVNIQRTTSITGWRFEGLIVLTNDVVLFRNFSGEARIDRTERQLNPLGPFQPAGESAGRSLLR